MASFKHSTHTVTLEVPFEKAWEFLSDWRNQPKWGKNFVKGIRQEDEQIIMTTPNGDVPIQWRTDRAHGTIDIIMPDGSPIPSRLIEIGDSLLYMFTFSVPADAPEKVLLNGQRGMQEELATLKSLLEG